MFHQRTAPFCTSAHGRFCSPCAGVTWVQRAFFARICSDKRPLSTLVSRLFLQGNIIIPADQAVESALLCWIARRLHFPAECASCHEELPRCCKEATQLNTGHVGVLNASSYQHRSDALSADTLISATVTVVLVACGECSKGSNSPS